MSITEIYSQHNKIKINKKKIKKTKMLELTENNFGIYDIKNILINNITKVKIYNKTNNIWIIGTVNKLLSNNTICIINKDNKNEKITINLINESKYIKLALIYY